MRKDYSEPDDYEYEPTPHDEVLERASPLPARHRGEVSRTTLMNAITPPSEQSPARTGGGYQLVRKGGTGEGTSSDGELLEIAMDRNTVTHGVFRMDVVLDGEKLSS